MNQAKCLYCKGEKHVQKYVGGFWSTYQYVTCTHCDGTGLAKTYWCLGCKKELEGSISWHCSNDKCKRYGLSTMLVLQNNPNTELLK